MSTTKHHVWRDSGTGQFVTEKYGKNHPGTTEHETIRK